MLVSMKGMLQHAHKNNYAVMAINCVNMELAKAIVRAAQDENSPVIINVSPRQMKAHATPELLAKMVKHLADNATVPVALNLDHGMEYDDIVRVIRAGFSSVMIDCSSLEYEDNVQRTSLITELAHEVGISVEAELGHVGTAIQDDNSNLDYYTNVDQALDFVTRTNVDCLAVAIGTAHGLYPKNLTPTLDFTRLAELKKSLNMPLVLHGGSGAGDENIKKAVELGINKINVCTDLFNYGKDAMLQAGKENPNIDYMDIQMVAEEAMYSYIRKYMNLIGSSGRYHYGLNNGPVVE